jgi:hypothetical protein
MINSNHTKMKNFEDFTLNEIINADFRAAVVFSKFGIDLTSNKSRTMQDVCFHFRLDPEIILDEIIEQMEVKVPMPFQMIA